MRNPDPDISPSAKPFHLDLDNLLHPALAFAHPREVVADPDLTLHEKRAILASWVSDSCAVEAAPAMRRANGGARAVSVDEIFDALQQLDRAPDHDANFWMRRQVRRASIEAVRERNASRENGVDPVD